MPEDHQSTFSPRENNNAQESSNAELGPPMLPKGMGGKTLPPLGYWQEWGGWGCAKVDTKVCFLKCKLTVFLKPYKLMQRITFKNHVSHTDVFHLTETNGLFCWRTDLWNSVSRSCCDQTVADLLAVEGNKWFQVDVNSHFSIAVVYSPASETLESTSHYVALKSCFPG